MDRSSYGRDCASRLDRERTVLAAGNVSDIDQCNPDIWFGERDARRVHLLAEQLLDQLNGYSMTPLQAQSADADDDDDEAADATICRWR